MDLQVQFKTGGLGPEFAVTGLSPFFARQVLTGRSEVRGEGRGRGAGGWGRGVPASWHWLILCSVMSLSDANTCRQLSQLCTASSSSSSASSGRFLPSSASPSSGLSSSLQLGSARKPRRERRATDRSPHGHTPSPRDRGQKHTVPGSGDGGGRRGGGCTADLRMEEPKASLPNVSQFPVPGSLRPPHHRATLAPSPLSRDLPPFDV